MKNVLLKTSNYIVENFGFQNVYDFLSSMFHRHLFNVTIPLAALAGFLELYLGLKSLSIVAFALLLIGELLTGIAASLSQGQKITSKKFSRFGFKAVFWFFLFFLFTTFQQEYKSNNVIYFNVFSYLHSTLVFYVCMEYIISIDENAGRFFGVRGGFIGGFVDIIKEKFNTTKNENK